ncbi:MAG: DUF3168 domain-containing protein [Chloroflexi bacterium]|nr:DUF3168 domain-containing protein [Chloroflexota bacterium]
MGIESLRIDAWLYSVLSGDATLVSALGGTKVYSDLAPQDAALPYVVFGQQAPHDVMGVGTARIMVTNVYQVKVVGQGGSYQPLQAAADQVDALLHAASGTASGGTVLACVRDAVIRYTETDDGVQYRHVGGLYRITAQS